MTDTIKKMSPSEFRRLGYLRELNRVFLHPIGLALEIVVGENGEESFGEVWDYREDPEGLAFSNEMLNEQALDDALRIGAEREAKEKARTKLFGSIIQSFSK